jgi:hypothetical protein
VPQEPQAALRSVPAFHFITNTSPHVEGFGIGSSRAANQYSKLTIDVENDPSITIAFTTQSASIINTGLQPLSQIGVQYAYYIFGGQHSELGYRHASPRQSLTNGVLSPGKRLILDSSWLLETNFTTSAIAGQAVENFNVFQKRELRAIIVTFTRVLDGRKFWHFEPYIVMPGSPESVNGATIMHGPRLMGLADDQIGASGSVWDPIEKRIPELEENEGHRLVGFRRLGR